MVIINDNRLVKTSYIDYFMNACYMCACIHKVSKAPAEALTAGASAHSSSDTEPTHNGTDTNVTHITIHNISLEITIKVKHLFINLILLRIHRFFIIHFSKCNLYKIIRVIDYLRIYSVKLSVMVKKNCQII